MVEIIQSDKHKVVPLDSLRGTIRERLQQQYIYVILVVLVPWFAQVVGGT